MKRSNDHAACSGCSLCLLVCPMWRSNRDISLSAHGYAKALQHGAAAGEIAFEIWTCSLCGACDPVCPEQIDVTGMILDQRRQLAHPEEGVLLERMATLAASPLEIKHAAVKLLPDQSLLDHPETLERIVKLLDIPLAEDDGADIAQALEMGVVVPAGRMQRFLAAWRGTKKIVVADGLLLKHLKQLLIGVNFVSLGEELSNHPAVRSKLCADDLYVIESRAYHADYQRLVKYYDRLRAESGSAFNLDLQRIAIPASSRSFGTGMDDANEQARWVLHGHNVKRIVVESLHDRAALETVSPVPVVHLADLHESFNKEH